MWVRQKSVEDQHVFAPTTNCANAKPLDKSNQAHLLKSKYNLKDQVEFSFLNCASVASLYGSIVPVAIANVVYLLCNQTFGKAQTVYGARRGAA